MSSPLEQISELHNLIRELHKMNSKLLSGQVILAHRDLNRIIADLERRTQNMVHPDRKDQNDTKISDGDII